MITRPSWDNYFIAIADTVSTRATCLRRSYGAVIVKDNIIISTGYNGAARGVPNCTTCIRKDLNIKPGTQYELCMSVHAEANAIIMGNPEKMQGAVIYIAGIEVESMRYADAHPCSMCYRLIRNAGISKVVFRNQHGDIEEIEIIN